MQLTKLAPGRYSLRDVLNEVVRRVDDEPKRLGMNYFTSMVDGVKLVTSYTIEAPDCGTVCCAAGHGYLAVTGEYLPNDFFHVPEAIFLRLFDKTIEPHVRDTWPQWATAIRDRVFYCLVDKDQTRAQVEGLKLAISRYLEDYATDVDRLFVDVKE